MKTSDSRSESNAQLSGPAGAGASWQGTSMPLRIPYSIYFMPVFWFAMSNSTQFDGWTAVALFIIIHVLLYPSAIGYNYYFADEQADFPVLHRLTGLGAELFWLVMLFDFMAVLSAWFISPVLAMLTLIYALGSKTHGIAKPWLQRLPSLGTAIVSVFQGAFVYGMVLIGLEEEINEAQLVYAGISSLFIAGIYPLSHIGQWASNIKSAKRMLATFVYAGLMFFIAICALIVMYIAYDRYVDAALFLTGILGPGIYFLRWWRLVKLDRDHANQQNANNLQSLASLTATLAFVAMMW